MMPTMTTCRTVERIVGDVRVGFAASSLECTAAINGLYDEAKGQSSSLLWQTKR